MPKIGSKTILKRAFEVASEEEGLWGTKLERKVRDCILDYIPAVKAHGLRYRPVIFGLKRMGNGVTLIACSEEIRRMNPDGLQLNADEYNTVEALMVAAEMNRIFERV